jgi:hypothetical protein
MACTQSIAFVCFAIRSPPRTKYSASGSAKIMFHQRKKR